MKGRTITHTHSGDKSSHTFYWTAPDTDMGDLHFIFTVVQSYSVYWVDMTTITIGFDPSPRTTPALPTTASEGPVTQMPIDEIDMSGCGVSKSCYRQPESCTEDCEYIVTWKVNGTQYVNFEMEALMNGDLEYMAMGLSKDQSMGDDSVVDCIYKGTAEQPVDVQMSYNSGSPKSNSVLSQPYIGLTNRQGFFASGKITCRFSREIDVQNVPPEDEDKVFDLDDNLYSLLVAKGRVDFGFKVHHQTTKLIVPTEIDFTSTDPVDIGGEVGFPFVKAHGILMIFAWMVSASVAVLMPRYNKNSWPDRKCAGKPIWFQIHISLMTSTLLLTVAGFIVIFVSVGGYVQYEAMPDKAHPVLGIITTCLVVINPIMAAFRPHPGTPKRPIFNVCHFIVGLGAHVCAIATIFVAMFMPKANPPVWGKWIMVAFICWHVLIEALLAIHMHILRRHIKESKPSKYELESTAPGSQTPIHQTAPKNSGSGVNTFLVSLHLLGVLGLALALAIPIGSA